MLKEPAEIIAAIDEWQQLLDEHLLPGKLNEKILNDWVELCNKLNLVVAPIPNLRLSLVADAKESFLDLLRLRRDNVPLTLSDQKKVNLALTRAGGELAQLRRYFEKAGPDVRHRKTVEEVVAHLEQLRLHCKFTSQQKLARQLGCSSGTINKAINKRGTPELKAWAKQPEAKPKAQSLNEVVTDQTAQRTEPNPEDDAAIREFIENADPENRAWFLALQRDQQLEYLNDPDASKPGPTGPVLHQKILGRKP
jgi:hypothetical protein